MAVPNKDIAQKPNRVMQHLLSGRVNKLSPLGRRADVLSLRTLSVKDSVIRTLPSEADRIAAPSAAHAITTVNSSLRLLVIAGDVLFIRALCDGFFHPSSFLKVQYPLMPSASPSPSLEMNSGSPLAVFCIASPPHPPTHPPTHTHSLCSFLVWYNTHENFYVGG